MGYGEIEREKCVEMSVERKKECGNGVEVENKRRKERG